MLIAIPKKAEQIFGMGSHFQAPHRSITRPCPPHPNPALQKLYKLLQRPLQDASLADVQASQRIHSSSESGSVWYSLGSSFCSFRLSILLLTT